MEFNVKEKIIDALSEEVTGETRWLTNVMLFEIAQELEKMNDALRQLNR